MKKVKKYTSFGALKAGEKEVVNNKVSLQRHCDFEKIIRFIYSEKIHQREMCNLNEFEWKMNN
jgi:hypothetical protein